MSEKKALAQQESIDNGECRSCVGSKCTTGPECVTLGRDAAQPVAAQPQGRKPTGDELRAIVNGLRGSSDGPSLTETAYAGWMAALSAQPVQDKRQEAGQVRELPPPSTLPDWSECNRIIENHEFRLRAAAGVEGQVLDTPPTTPEPTALHRFIHEYDDADRYRSAWFMHSLELALKEAAQAAPAVPVDNPDELEPPELLASRLITAWCDHHGKQIPWAKAIEISAIITKMPAEEKAALLALDDAAPPAQQDPVAAQPQDEDLLPHLRQFMHNDGSGLVAGYDKLGVDRLVSFMRAKATPNFETTADDALSAFIDRAKRLYTGNPKDHPDWAAFETGFNAAVAQKSAQPQEALEKQ